MDFMSIDEYDREALHERYTTIDCADHYFSMAEENYYFGEYGGKSYIPKDEDRRKIYEYAGMHIAFFLTWIIKHKFDSGLWNGFTVSFGDCANGSEALEALRNEKITGSDFLIEYCDNIFDGEMLSDEIYPFVKDFYENDMKKVYSDWAMDNGLLPLDFEWSWKDYHSFEKILDREYVTYLRRML